MTEAVTTKLGALSMQVCVPKELTDEQVIEFAEDDNPSGTDKGWIIRKQGDESLMGKDERVVCEDDPEKVHIMLDV